jgi:hypothetical protein
MTKRTRLFFDALFGQAKLQTKVAAEMAGFTDLRQGYNVINRYRPYYESRLDEFRATMQMSPDEVVEVLTEIAKDKGHKDRVRATELLGKIHGLFNEKITVRLDRTELTRSIDGVLTLIGQAAPNAPTPTPPSPYPN